MHRGEDLGIEGNLGVGVVGDCSDLLQRIPVLDLAVSTAFGLEGGDESVGLVLWNRVEEVWMPKRKLIVERCDVPGAEEAGQEHEEDEYTSHSRLPFTFACRFLFFASPMFALIRVLLWRSEMM